MNPSPAPALASSSSAPLDSLTSGPLSLLTDCVRSNFPVLVSCRNNRKLIGRLKAFDRHMNLLMENVQELWTEMPAAGKGKKKSKPINRDRFIPKLFLRGDSVILVLKNPV